MTPILYRNEELDFTSNGLGRLTECISCEVTEERNGIYECEFVYPVTGKHFEYMTKQGGVVSVIHDDQKDRQPFDIYKYSAPIDGNVTFYACHISYRLRNIPVKPFAAGSCAAALAGIKSNSLQANPFTFWTDKAVSADFRLSVPASARPLLAGQQGSILDVYGKGEYKFDKFEVKLYTNRGTNSGVSIRYGKNLVDYRNDTDNGSVYNGIAPYWFGYDGTVVTLPEWAVLSQNGQVKTAPWTNENGVEITDGNGNVIDFQYVPSVIIPVDFSDKYEEAPTVEQLRQAAQTFLTNNQPWLPNENITVDFAQLWQTEDYKNVAVLQRVSLCDTVAVVFPAYGFTKSIKVIKVVYDVLQEKYKTMELGQPQTTLGEAINEPIEALLNEKPSMGDMDAAIAQSARDTETAYIRAIKAATDLITGGLGGYLVIGTNANGEPEELLIMDTPDKSTAVNVWRFNKNGLGHSSNGYNGPFSDLALTADGKINASMILTGYLVANFIKGGTLTLGGDNNEDGVFIINDANGNEVVKGNKDGLAAKALTATDYVYINGGSGSYMKFPLASSGFDQRYLQISNDQDKPFLIHLYNTLFQSIVETVINSYGLLVTSGTYEASVTTSGVGAKWGTDETVLDYNKVQLKASGVARTDIEQGYIVFKDENGVKRAEISPETSPHAGYYGVKLYDASGNIWAKIAPAFLSGEPELQLFGHNGNGDAYLAPGTGLRLGSMTMNESQLQRLLALI